MAIAKAVWDNRHMRALWRFFCSIFWNGPTRYIMLTGPSVLLRVAALFVPGPWKPEWWAYVLAIMTGIIICAYISWHEQYTLRQEISGRPDVTLQVSPNRSFLLRLGNDKVAVNVTIQDIIIPFPQHVIDLAESWKEWVGASGSYDLSQSVQQKDFIVRWDTCQSLHRDDFVSLACTVVHTCNDILFALDNAPNEYTDGTKKFPLVLIFSNLGEPKRTWHSHYVLLYEVMSKNLSVRHLSIGELNNTRKCSGCLADGMAD
jgi:hypothetical protein